MEKKDILSKYSEKVLAIRLYKSENQKFHSNDFLRLDVLKNCLNEVITGESDLTEDGKNFLSEYYSLEELAQSLVEIGGLDEGPFLTKNQIMDWFKSVKALDTLDFIDSVRESKDK